MDPVPHVDNYHVYEVETLLPKSQSDVEDKHGVIAAEKWPWLSVSSSSSEEEDIGFDPGSSRDPLLRRICTRQVVRAGALHAVNLAKRLLLFILPSFISALVKKPSTSAMESERTTAYLDGLRGMAAWCVFNQHLAGILLRDFGAGWALPDEHNRFGNSEVYKLPIIRLILSGEFAVSIFFVISGFVLSLSFLSEVRRVPRRDYLRRLAGQIVRRPLRLLGPSWTSSLITFFLVQFGYFAFFIKHEQQYQELLKGRMEFLDAWPKQMSFWNQTMDLFAQDMKLVDIFKPLQGPLAGTKYNGVTWTIVGELRGSMVLYMTHAALFYTRKSLRTGTIVGLCLLAFLIGSWDLPAFWLGYLIAEYSSISSADAQDKCDRRYPFLKDMLWVIVLLIGAFIGGFPSRGARPSSLWLWMKPLTPPAFDINANDSRFWCTVGAVLCLLAITRLRLAQRFLCLPPVAYMGKISFGLYLCHYPIVLGLGYSIFYTAWSFTGRSGELDSLLGFCIAYPILIGISIWEGDLFWRAVDKPITNFTFTMQKWFMREEP